MSIYMHACRGWAHTCQDTRMGVGGHLVEICSGLSGLDLRLSGEAARAFPSGASPSLFCITFIVM